MTLEDKIGFVRRMQLVRKGYFPKSGHQEDSIFFDSAQKRTIILDAKGRAQYGSMRWHIEDVDFEHRQAGWGQTHSLQDKGPYIIAQLSGGLKGIIHRDGTPFGRPFDGEVDIKKGEITTITIDEAEYVKLFLKNDTVGLMSETDTRTLKVNNVFDTLRYKGRDILEVVYDGGSFGLIDSDGKDLVEGLGVRSVDGIVRFAGNEYLSVVRQDKYHDLVLDGQLLFGDDVRADKIHGSFAYKATEVLYTEEKDGKKTWHRLREYDGKKKAGIKFPIEGIVNIGGKDFLKCQRNGRSVLRNVDQGKWFGDGKGYELISYKTVTDPNGKSYILAMEGLRNDIGYHAPARMSLIDEEGKMFGEPVKCTQITKNIDGTSREAVAGIVGVEFTSPHEVRFEWEYFSPSPDTIIRITGYMSESGELSELQTQNDLPPWRRERLYTELDVAKLQTK